MGADMLLRRHVDRSRAELRLPDPEGLLDLPPLLVHGKDLLRRPVQGRRDGVEAVEAFLLPDSLPIDLVPADLGGFRVLPDMRGLDSSRRVVRAFPPFLEVRAQQLLRTVLAAIGYGKPSKSRVLEAMEGHVTEGSRNPMNEINRRHRYFKMFMSRHGSYGRASIQDWYNLFSFAYNRRGEVGIMVEDFLGLALKPTKVMRYRTVMGSKTDKK